MKNKRAVLEKAFKEKRTELNSTYSELERIINEMKDLKDDQKRELTLLERLQSEVDFERSETERRKSACDFYIKNVLSAAMERDQREILNVLDNDKRFVFNKNGCQGMTLYFYDKHKFPPILSFMYFLISNNDNIYNDYGLSMTIYGTPLKLTKNLCIENTEIYFWETKRFLEVIKEYLKKS